MNRLHTSLHLDHGSVTVNASFGELLGVMPMTHVPGQDHQERVKVQFRGACFEFEAAAFIELLRRGPEAVAALPRTWAAINGADVSGSVADIREQG